MPCVTANTALPPAIRVFGVARAFMPWGLCMSRDPQSRRNRHWSKLLRLEALARSRATGWSRRSCWTAVTPGLAFSWSAKARALAWLHPGYPAAGTRLARPVLLAVDPACRGQGVASQLIEQGRNGSGRCRALYMRLEQAAWP